MRLICPHCQSENMMGTMYCRTCGQKIVLGKMRAEDFNVQKDKINWVRVLYHVQMWATFLFVVWLVSLLFRSEKLVDISSYTEKQYEAEGKRLTSVLMDQVPGKFTSEQATAGLTEMLKINGKKVVEVPDSAMNLKAASVRFQEEKVTIVLRTAMLGINHDNVLVMRVTDGEDGKPKFTIVSSRIGKFPFIGPLRKMLLDRFEVILRCDKTGAANTVHYRILSAKVKDGEAQMTATKWRPE